MSWTQFYNFLCANKHTKIACLWHLYKNWSWDKEKKKKKEVGVGIVPGRFLEDYLFLRSSERTNFSITFSSATIEQTNSPLLFTTGRWGCTFHITFCLTCPWYLIEQQMITSYCVDYFFINLFDFLAYEQVFIQPLDRRCVNLNKKVLTKRYQEKQYFSQHFKQFYKHSLLKCGTTANFCTDHKNVLLFSLSVLRLGEKLWLKRVKMSLRHF